MMTCAGLDELLRTRAVPPSPTSLLGLVRHLTDVERAWFRRVLAGRHHRGFAFSLRWTYLHMLEEYARRNGHADLLRERIDDVTGE